MTVAMQPMIEVRQLVKQFTLHTQGGVVLPVLRGIDFSVDAGECVVLSGPSGCGKSTLLRCLYGSYKVESGRAFVRHFRRWVDIAAAEEREILQVRRHTLGYVSQFLRVVPRVAAIDVVAEPLLFHGVWPEEGRRCAAALLARLRIPERLWKVAPATFSGGEQQRVNLARGFIAGYPILLVDEPTASLDSANRATVIELIAEAKQAGTAVVMICHDGEVRDAVADRLFELPGKRRVA
jgi:alpha-D-ribose 1-methylphosphonate 5-triphosphate synthase subunit PhnL